MGFALVDHSRRYLLSEWADRLSASISRELARGNHHCEVELAGPAASPAHPPPPVNTLALRTVGYGHRLEGTGRRARTDAALVRDGAWPDGSGGDAAA